MRGMAKCVAAMGLVLLGGCATTEKSRIAAGHPAPEFREAYEVYPGVAGNGVSKHLVRSHTTAILVRPGSSAVALCSRGGGQIWDWMRRFETRFVRFPILNHASIPELSPNTNGMDLVAWEEYLGQLTGNPPSSAKIDFLMDGEPFYAALIESIDNARTSIDIQTYLFDNDDVARGIADRLRARSNEIEVRVMYDGLGTYLSHSATAPSQPEESEFIENIPRYLCEGSNIQLRVIPNIWLSGNHVKSMIFDRQVAFVGGMNIGREYRHDWHDMMLRIEGPAVGMLSENYNATWRHSGWGGDFAMLLPEPTCPVQPEIAGGVPVRFLQTLPTTAQIYKAQLEAIRRAHSYIYIENCYFSDDRILYELCRARKRGVDVRVILPNVVNHKIMERSNRVAINVLLKHGARVYAYPGMLHIKAAVYDGWICVGTANFDKLSLQIIRELNLATSHPETVKQLCESLFEPDFRKSTEITEPLPLTLTDHLIELVADET